jgi:hypothetical protein
MIAVAMLLPKPVDDLLSRSARQACVAAAGLILVLVLAFASQAAGARFPQAEVDKIYREAAAKPRSEQLRVVGRPEVWPGATDPGRTR